VNASLIVLSNALVVIETRQNRLFGVPRVHLKSIETLPIGNLSLPGKDPWKFCASAVYDLRNSPSFGSSFDANQSFVVSVLNASKVSIEASTGILRGFAISFMRRGYPQSPSATAFQSPTASAWDRFAPFPCRRKPRISPQMKV
jgi:hypothetical protein